MKYQMVCLPDGGFEYRINGKTVTQAEFDKTYQVKHGGLAECIKLRKAPRCMTDDVFFGGQSLAQQFATDPVGLKQVTDAAIRNGYIPKAGDRYESGLCRSEVGVGDPQAFVPNGGGRGYVKKLLESRGWEGSSDGAVKVKYREPEKEPTPIPMGKNILDMEVKKMVRKDPKLAKVDKRELRAEVIYKQGYK